MAWAKKEDEIPMKIVDDEKLKVNQEEDEADTLTTILVIFAFLVSLGSLVFVCTLAWKMRSILF